MVTAAQPAVARKVGQHVQGCHPVDRGVALGETGKDRGRWHFDAVRDHAGRLLIMLPGVALIGAATVSPAGKATAEIFGGVCLLLGGYLAPGIKSFIFKVAGNEFSANMHERLERTKEDVEISEELDSGAAVVVEEDEVVGMARFYAASFALERLLQSEGPLAGCSMHLYLYDDDAGGLVPTEFETNERVRSLPPWRSGQGVTGMAYETGQLQLAVGEQTHDGTFNLDSEQQTQHTGLSAVAAVPIVNNAGRVIAVLSASERNGGKPECALITEDAQKELIGRALLASRILVDLLGWFDDDDAG